MEFEDRVSANPNRVLITPESGDAFYATVVRADNPEKVGTPLTADTFNEMMAVLRIPVMSATLI